MSETERPALLSQLRKLLGQSAVYGLADVLPGLLGLLLAPLLTRLMTPAEYGALALLGLFSSLCKIVFRLGLDGAFLRLHYDQAGEGEQRLLVGTTVLFSAAAGTALGVLVLLGVGPLTHALFAEAATPRDWILLTASDIYLAAFSFVPQALLRIQDRVRLFSGLNLARQTLNLALKVVLLLMGFGVTGVLVSDLLATALFALALLPTLSRHLALSFSWRLLGDLLGFGLPKVPHGFMLQVQNLADRRILREFVSLSDVGIYNVGYAFGNTVKFAISAFEPAWAPFIYSQAGRPGGQGALARLVTYVLAGFTYCALGVAVLGREVVRVMTAPAFHDAAAVVPIVALAYWLHGLFLLTSIGIGIQKRAGYYPLLTLASAATNLAGNFLLIPHFGVLGAAWATVASYLVMAVLGLAVSRRLYPMPLEVGRLLRLAVVAALVFALSRLAPTGLGPALAVKAGLLLAFPALL
ncbi:MAG TPA: oligosaccharide flippase family protein, partial [Vicinamibacteria bacterium]|nr:oligosaccharide flippase family protein [Vicinamibacteria bacterium]